MRRVPEADTPANRSCVTFATCGTLFHLFSLCSTIVWHVCRLALSLLLTLAGSMMHLLYVTVAFVGFQHLPAIESDTLAVLPAIVVGFPVQSFHLLSVDNYTANQDR